ncbi:tetraacyldisaccharide 4'-kinase [Postechiella marina]|uniref:Tetraacyldisaccharide 4'-kinase n=1 Tax=Postechiella marina TaxID=943941 RepID=A0ABP8CAM0_9FLAO
MYDLGLKKSTSYKIPIVCVGNLSTGGTGKTPMIEYLVRLLKDNHSLATLSRGYKRKSKGFQLGTNKADANSLGDEPYQFYTKFKDEVLVAVDADRNNGIKRLLALKNAPNVILLDDAFQHRKVQAGFNIMLSTYSNLFIDDMVLPTGNLREPKCGAKRANIIVVTKCPFDLSGGQKAEIISKIKPASHQNVFFSSILYSDVVFNNKTSLNLKDLPQFTLITGIANAKPLVDFLDEKDLKFDHIDFDDHYNFTTDDLRVFEEKELLITTEKDFMRLKQHESLKDKLYFLPIKSTVDNASKFDALIKDFINLN